MLSAILVSTILGATIGFGASYMTFFPQIQNLQDNLLRAKTDLNSEIDKIKADLSKATDDISDASAEIDGVKADVFSLQTDLSSAYIIMTNLQSNLSSVQSDCARALASLDKPILVSRPSYAFNKTYQNTSNRTLIAIIAGSSTRVNPDEEATVWGLIGDTDPPLMDYAFAGLVTGAVSEVLWALVFIVPPQWYYRLNEGYTGASYNIIYDVTEFLV
jgi:hypothetical protein